MILSIKNGARVSKRSIGLARAGEGDKRRPANRLPMIVGIVTRRWL